MNITLREITPENFKECINLKVADGQQKFVAANVMSMAQAKVYPAVTPMAVYAGDEMVGFVMYGFDTDDEKYYLIRLMIDERQQGRGYGRGATLEVIEKMKQIAGCREIFLSFVPDNTGAERLYLSLGFEPTGEISEEGEIVMRFDLQKSANNAKPESEI